MDGEDLEWLETPRSSASVKSVVNDDSVTDSPSDSSWFVQWVAAKLMTGSMERRDVKFEPTGHALGPKSGPAGLLCGLTASCWGHAGLRMNCLMLKGYTTGLDAGL